jgi:hypothetical protein
VVPKLKLTYFDFHGGRGEPARLALSMAGIPFEDDRVSPSDWERRKPDTPFGALPSTVRHLLSRMPSTAMWASSPTSIRPTHGRLLFATRRWRR